MWTAREIFETLRYLKGLYYDETRIGWELRRELLMNDEEGRKDGGGWWCAFGG